MSPEKKRAVFHQSYVALAVGIGALNMIMALSYTSPALSSLKEDPDLKITDEQGSWIGAVVPGMALVGSLIAGKLVDICGRKFALIITSVPFTLAWIGTAVSQNVTSIILSRCLAGIAMGAQRVSMSVIMAETIEVTIRPMLTIIPATMAALGFLLVDALGSNLNWRALAFVGASISSLVILFAPILPESPFYLLKNGHESDALTTLKWLRRSEKFARKEFDELKNILQSQTSKGALKVLDLFKPPYRWPFLVGLGIHISQQCTGVIVFSSFLGTIFQNSESSISRTTCSAVISTVAFILIFITGRLYQKYPRKPFLKMSTFVVLMGHITLCFYFWIRNSEGILRDISEYLSLLPFLGCITFNAGFALGWGLIPWMFLGEGIPSKARGLASGIITATNWGTSFLISKSFISITKSFGMHASFMGYGIVTCFSTFILLKHMPETFSKTAVEMDRFYLKSYNMKYD